MGHGFRGRTGPRLGPGPRLWELQRLLHAAFRAERPPLALALGGGLSEHEARGLRRDDLLVRTSRRRLRAPDGRTRTVTVATVQVTVPASRTADPYGLGLVRVAPLPGWAVDLIASSPKGLLSQPGSAYLFPHRSDPDRPRDSFRSMMTRLCARALGPRGARYSMADLRRAWQVIAREADLPRAVVRQSWSVEPDPAGRWAGCQEVDHLRRLAEAWPTLGAEVARALLSAPSLPRRAPKGCGPGDPERVDPWAGWRSLPPSCTT